MALSAGDRLGPYEIVAPLGAGGMGEVYRSRDSKLNREVAIKVLPAALANDADYLARFQREAQVLATLNHPNIASIYGLEDKAIVMELVEGQTLAEQIAAGPLPLDEALGIAKQIAEALEAAHEKGIVHRDLKPGNVKITPDGVVKVLDFGLAKTAEASSANPASSPTLTIRATQAGFIMGTAGYMSPEQAAGKPVDKRADIWSFGVVLWEMLTGRQLFQGETISHTLAHVLTAPIDFGSLPATAPAVIRDLVRRCLDREVRTRLRDIGEARVAIQKYLSQPAVTEPTKEAAQVGKPWLAWGVAAMLFAALAPGNILHYREKPPEAVPVRFRIQPPEKTFWRPSDLPAISPDGKRIVYSAVRDGRPLLFMRSLDSFLSQPIPGTEGASVPFWSPDNRTIAFFVAGRLNKVEISGGPVQTICVIPAGGFDGGTWNRDGLIVFTAGPNSPLFRVAASGGEAKQLIQPNTSQGDVALRSPCFLPDGHHFLFQLSGRADRHGTYIGLLDSKETIRLFPEEFNAQYAAPFSGGPAYLVFPQGDTLMARPFDPKKLKLLGDAFPVAEQAALFGFIPGALFSVSENGVLAYRAGTGVIGTQLVWYDRGGKRLATLGDPGAYTNPALSPDGKKLAVGKADPQTRMRNIWIFDLVRGNSSRFTFGSADDMNPVWSPDGSHIAFSSARKGHRDLYWKASNGTGQEELLLESAMDKSVEDWSPDGRLLLYNIGMGRSIWSLPLAGDDPAAHKPTPLLQAQFSQNEAQISPNGRWLAYRSSESGRFEVYVQSLPIGKGKWQISTAGGSELRWRGDGKELFFQVQNTLMAVDVKTDGSSFEAGIPHALFEAPMGNAGRNNYVVSRDGQRFVLNVATDQAVAAPINVVLNFAARPK